MRAKDSRRVLHLVHLMVSLLILVVLLLWSLVFVLVIGFRIGTGHIGPIIGVRHRRYDLFL